MNFLGGGKYRLRSSISHVKHPIKTVRKACGRLVVCEKVLICAVLNVQLDEII